MDRTSMALATTKRNVTPIMTRSVVAFRASAPYSYSIYCGSAGGEVFFDEEVAVTSTLVDLLTSNGPLDIHHFVGTRTDRLSETFSNTNSNTIHLMGGYV